MQPVRKALHIFLFLFISQFLEPLHVGALEELIVDDDGNFVSAADVPISCRVLNELDTDIDVYYDDDTPAGVYMFSVNKMEARGLNTFPGHRFYARRKGASVNGEIVTDYMSSRGPPDADIIFSRRFSRENGEKHHPSIFSVDEPYPEVDADAYPRITYFKDRPEQVTQVPAKFRSLSPRPIELFYDDGSKEGVIQAALQLGTESTTNSYLGHTFVARPQGDKTTEIARFTISREKFLYLIFDDQDKYPAPKNLLDLSTEEERFNSEYVKKNGFLWRHYY